MYRCYLQITWSLTCCSCISSSSDEPSWNSKKNKNFLKWNYYEMSYISLVIEFLIVLRRSLLFPAPVTLNTNNLQSYKIIMTTKDTIGIHTIVISVWKHAVSMGISILNGPPPFLNQTIYLKYFVYWYFTYTMGVKIFLTGS